MHWLVKGMAVCGVQEMSRHSHGFVSLLPTTRHLPFMRHFIETQLGYCAHKSHAYRRVPYMCREAVAGRCVTLRKADRKCEPMQCECVPRFTYHIDPHYVGVHRRQIKCE